MSQLRAKQWLIIAGFVLVLAACRPAQPKPALVEPATATGGGTLPVITVEVPGTATAGVPMAAPQSMIGADTVQDLQKVGSLEEQGANSISWMANDQAMAMATYNKIIFDQVATSSQVGQVDALTPTLLTPSPGNNILAWVNGDNSVSIYYLDSNRTVAIPAQGAPVTGLTLSHNGDLLAAATYDQQIKLIDAASGEIRKNWPVTGWLSNLAFSPDGLQLAGTDLENFMVRFYDLASGAELRTLAWTESANPALYGVYFSPDWEKVAWAARGTVQLMDVSAGNLGPTLEHEDYASAVSWSADSSLVAVASAATIDGQLVPAIILWDASSGEKIKVLPQAAPVSSMSFSGDGRLLTALQAGGVVQTFAVVR